MSRDLDPSANFEPPPASNTLPTVLRALLMSDLVESTRLVARLGDRRAAELFARHERAARDLLEEHSGREVDKTDGFLLLFESPGDAARYALAYHLALKELATGNVPRLQARVGIHFGEVLLRHNPPEDVARGAKALEVEGLAKPLTSRLMSLAGGGQTLLTRAAFDAARQNAQADGELRWLAHGEYVFKGIEDPVEVCEIGVEGESPLSTPQASDKVSQAPSQGIVPGWRPAPGLDLLLRPNWVMERKLGEGGFGEVWLAHQAKTGERRVFKFCFETARLRALEREITLFRLLKEELGERDDIVRILDWNFDEAPFFIESEYTAGGDLADWAAAQGGLAAAQGGLAAVPLATRLELVAQVAEALAAAHSVGVLHKDVKPGNVLVRDAAGRLQARLADFGIALLTDQARLERAGITLLGITQTVATRPHSGSSGTPLYQAPELMEGKTATVQADIYALGVVLFQMAVGDFGRALGPGWEREVEDALLREDIAAAVDADPRRRLGNALRVAERLRALETRREKRREAERARAAQARWRRLRRIGSAAAVISVLFGGAMWWQSRQTAREAERANREAEAARKVSEFLVEMFESSNPFEAQRGAELSARQILDRGAQRLRGELEDQPAIRARLLDTIGSVYSALSLYDDAEPLLREGLEIRESIPGVGEVDVAESLHNLAAVYLRQGRYEDAERLLRQVLAIREERLGADHLDVSFALSDLAWTEFRLGRYGEAEALFRRAVKVQEKHHGLEHLDVASMLASLGSALSQQGKTSESEGVSRRSLAIREKELGPDHPLVGVSLNNLSALYKDLGEYASAEPLLVRALAIYQEGLGPDHLRVAFPLTNLGDVYCYLGRCEEARPLLQRALELLEAAVGPDSQLVAHPLCGLGRVAREQGRYDEAEARFRRALALWEAVSVENPEAAQAVFDLAVLYHRQSQHEAAEPLFLRALKMREEGMGPSHPRTAEVLEEYAAHLRATGQEAAAEEAVARAMAIRAQHRR